MDDFSLYNAILGRDQPTPTPTQTPTLDRFRKTCRCAFCQRNVPVIFSLRVARLGICPECLWEIMTDPRHFTAKGHCWFCIARKGMWRDRTVPLANLAGEAHWGICPSCAWFACSHLHDYLSTRPKQGQLTFQDILTRQQARKGARHGLHTGAGS